MSDKVTVPNLGESVSEAELIRWLKQDGELVREDEPIAEIETDKASVEINAPSAGRLRHKVSANTSVQIGDLVAEIEAADVSEAPAASAPAKPAEAEARPQREASESGPATPSGAAPAGEAPQGNRSSGALSAAAQAVMNRLSPSLRKLVREHDIDPEKIQASGPGGRILESDVLRHVPGAPSTSPAPAAPQRVSRPVTAAGVPAEADYTLVPMSKIRKTIAKRLVQAQHEAAMLTTFNEIDMGEVLELRKRYKENFEERHQVGLGLMSFFARAVVMALKEFPAVNASIEGDNIRYSNPVHLGVAVSTDRGLMVPVLKNAQSMTFAQIESRIKEVAKSAREGKLGLDELSGGTFTITNGGVFGSLFSTPILNPPQSGILGLHAIQKRAKVMPNDEIVARPMMFVALSYDHRLVDGRESVSFLVRVKELIEDPSRLLLDV